MVHTPILPKKIDWSAMISDRITFDTIKNNADSMHDYFLNNVIHGAVSENTARSIVFSDFHKRFYNKKGTTPLFFVPNVIDISPNHSQQVYIKHYEEQYASTKKLLDSLSINNSLYTTFNNTIWPLYHSDEILHNNHRVGLRSDVVYYNIAYGKIVPDHRIVINEINWPLYTIRFFLNSTKETILWDIVHPFYLFGCVALLVNPNDKRYKKLRGKEIILPITNKQVPIIPYEWVSIEWHGTRILVPTHNREDFQIALELWLSIDTYAFDKYGIFTDEAKIFAGKLLTSFADNVVKYIDDISNLDHTQQHAIYEYRDKNDWSLLFPILEKNIYIWLWNHDIDDWNFVSQYNYHGLWIESFKNDIINDEYFCISNQDAFQPIMTSLWWYLQDKNNTLQFTNLLQDIIYDFYVFRLLNFPARWDDIVDVLCYSFAWDFLWKIFYDYRISTGKYYESKDEIYTLLCRMTESDILSVEDVDVLLTYIDSNSVYIHTKNWYNINETYIYHYDNEYIGLSTLLNSVENIENFSFFYNKEDYKFVKYFIYLYAYIYKKPISINLFSLSSSVTLWSQWDNADKEVSPDALRLFLLQTVIINQSEDNITHYNLEQCERFLQKRWNLSRIIPLYKSSLAWLQDKILQKKAELSDYDTYLITKIHELYDEIVFLKSKDHIDQLVSLTVSTLRNEIADLLLYILKKNPSPVTELVAVYVILFSNHILYPFIPTTVLWFLHRSWYELERDFFVKEYVSFVDKNYKCNLMLHIISQWYQNIDQNENICWFVLQANRDFLEYFRSNYEQFIDFIGQEYTIRYVEENEDWPSDIVSHKIFTIQRWVTETIAQENTISTLPSLSVLQWQLQYKQQLLQTLKNTIVRLRATWSLDKISQFQTQIDTLLQEITDLEYQISKLKYF